LTLSLLAASRDSGPASSFVALSFWLGYAQLQGAVSRALPHESS